MKTPQSTSTPKDRLTFDRWDRLGLAVVLGLIAIATTVVTLVLPLIAWAQGENLTVAYVSPITVPELDAVDTAYGEGHYDVIVSDPTTAQRVFDLVPGLMTLPLVLAACWLVLRLMQDIGRGDAFRTRNVTRLRALAAILVIGLPIVFFANLSFTGALLSGAELGTLPPAAWIELPWPAFVAGMCLALLAEAFKAGSRLRDDVEGLV